MPSSLNGTGLTFNGGATLNAVPVTTLNGQSGAVVTTDLGAIGSTMALMIAVNSDIAANATIAGSSLRYNYTTTGSSTVGSTVGGNSSPLVGTHTQVNSSGYGGGGSSVSGTWRRMDSGLIFAVYSNCCGTTYIWGVGLFVRIS